jgi:ATP-dependent Clp protease ATP-binding subunit ClpB
LADRLGARIIGQPAAIAAVTDAVRVANLGLRGGDRPRAVLLFGGPTGVGKTALARTLAEVLFDDERALLRLDLSEFGGRHDAARLVGAPPGYIGYDDGGQLARFLRQHPESVVLLDEIEKAHPDILDLFLQVFDAGRVTDAQGQLADARHAYFILTTNVPLTDDLAALRRRLRPEFLNRIDRIVPFRPLELGDLERIAQARLEIVATDLQSRGIHLHADQNALACLARPEADGRPANGRTIERRLDQEVVAPVAELVTLLGGSPAAMPLILRLVPGEGGCRVVPQGLGGIAGGVA